MSRICILTGVVAILLGLGLAYGAMQHDSSPVTALIPAYVGIVFVILGVMGFNEKARKHVMHLAAALALLLALGSFGMGLPKIIKYQLDPDSVTTVRPLAWWGQVGLGVIMLVFLIFAVKSFVDARVNRKRAESTASNP